MSEKTKTVKIKNKEILTDDSLLLPEVWKYEDSDVLVDFPNTLIFTKKSKVLQPLLEELEKKIVLQEKVVEVGKILTPHLKMIKEVEYVFVLYSEVRNIIEIRLLLSNTKFDKNLSSKLFDLKLMVEDKFNEQEVDFITIPRFGRDLEEFISSNFMRVYP
jgi:hypothetical protein